MKTQVVLVKIAFMVKKLFDRQTGSELQAMKDHFEAAFSDAQLCALVAVGMICRVFGLVKPEAENSRSIWTFVGLFVQFLQSLKDPAFPLRSGPNPLDALVMEGVDELDIIGVE